MTDKVQKIREEVARIQLYTQSEVLKQVLDYIDEVQKEPVSIWHDASEEPKPNMELICVGQYGNPLVLSSNSDSFKSRYISKWAYFNDLLNLSNVERVVKNWKEPVSKDLGDYINELSKQFPEVSFAKLSRIAVRVAKWQQERDEADRKVMMMKKSFDAKILPANIEETEFRLDDYEEVAIITEMVNKGEFKMGDKVRVILIKEG